MGFGIVSETSRSRMPWPPQNRTTFTEVRSLEDLNARDRHDEARTPRTGIGQLPHDLVPQVPRQDPDVVRALVREAVGRKDGDVRARCETSVLVRVAIDGEGQHVRTDAAVVEERG